jgi:pSer/pThr/pTyr-binding forkhead associated (FHA) protein
MAEAESKPELTSTLHLGLRSVVGNSPADLIADYLSTSTAEERAVLQSALSADSNSAMVLIHRGPGRGARFLITAEGASIGRSPSNAIFLDDVTVSRKHASIAKSETGFIFTDLGSLNGSYINNIPTTEHQLAVGDEIQIGKFHLLFISATSSKNK